MTDFIGWALIFQGVTTTTLLFLGILIHTENFDLRLPQDKLATLQDTLQHWVTKPSCIRQDLKSHLGYLSQVTTVIPQSWVFLRQLVILITLVQWLLFISRRNFVQLLFESGDYSRRHLLTSASSHGHSHVYYHQITRFVRVRRAHPDVYARATRILAAIVVESNDNFFQHHCGYSSRAPYN